MNQDYLKQIIAHLRPDFGLTRVEFQGQDVTRSRRKHPTLNATVDDVLRRGSIGQAGMYFSPHGFKLDSEDPYSCRAEEVAASRCLYHDIDIRPEGQVIHEGRAPKPCYATKADAYTAVLEVCATYGIPAPTAVIDSGRGLHVYWRLNRDIHPSEFKQLGDRMKAMWLAADEKLAVDVTRGSSPGELMRVPGSINPKSGTYVWTYEGTALGAEVDPAVFAERLPNSTPAAAVLLPGEPAPTSYLSAEPVDIMTPFHEVYEGCEVLRAVWADAAAYSGYEAWQAVMMICQNDPDPANGLAMFHDHCSRMPNYDPVQINEEFSRGTFRGAPPRCSTIRAKLGLSDAACQSCPLYKQFDGKGTVMRAKVAQDRVNNLAYVEQQKQHAEVAAVQSQTATVSQADLELNIPNTAKDQGATSDRAWAKGIATLPNAKFDPHAGVAGYFYTENLEMLYAHTVEVERDAPPDPMTGEVRKIQAIEIETQTIFEGAFVWIDSVVLSQRQSTENYARLWVARGKAVDPEFMYFDVPLKSMTDHKSVLSAVLTAGVGLKTGMEKRLQAYINSTLHKVPQVAASTRFGWTSDDPAEGDSFSMCGMMIDRGGIRPMAAVGKTHDTMDKFRVRGDMDAQLEILHAYAEHGCESAKLMLCASVASPLFHATGMGSIMASITGTSGSGKTNLLLFMQSLWGYRDGLLLSGNDTANAIMGMLGTLNGIGAYLDEITNMQDEQFTHLAMSVTQGRQKNRMNSEAKLVASDSSWNLPVFCTSNQPLTTKILGFGDGADAARARVLDITVEIDPASGVERVLHNMDPRRANQLARMAKENSGYVGALVAQYVVRNHQEMAMLTRRAFEGMIKPTTTTGRFGAAFGAISLIGHMLLRRLIPHIWTVEDTDMSSIVDRMLKGTKSRRARDTGDVFSMLLGLMYVVEDRTIRFTEDNRRKNGLKLVSGNKSSPPSSLQVRDTVESAPLARVVAKFGDNDEVQLHIAIMANTFDKFFTHQGINPLTALAALDRHERVTLHQEPGEMVMVDPYEGANDPNVISTAMPAYTMTVRHTADFVKLNLGGEVTAMKR